MINCAMPAARDFCGSEVEAADPRDGSKNRGLRVLRGLRTLVYGFAPYPKGQKKPPHSFLSVQARVRSKLCWMGKCSSLIPQTSRIYLPLFSLLNSFLLSFSVLFLHSSTSSVLQFFHQQSLPSFLLLHYLGRGSWLWGLCCASTTHRRNHHKHVPDSNHFPSHAVNHVQLSIAP